MQARQNARMLTCNALRSLLPHFLLKFDLKQSSHDILTHLFADVNTFFIKSSHKKLARTVMHAMIKIKWRYFCQTSPLLMCVTKARSCTKSTRRSPTKYCGHANRCWLVEIIVGKANRARERRHSYLCRASRAEGLTKYTAIYTIRAD
jgi:hypothetical protein